MKYLLINGSPRKGNTWMVAELVKKEIARISPESSFEELQLEDLDLPFGQDGREKDNRYLQEVSCFALNEAARSPMRSVGGEKTCKGMMLILTKT